MSKPLFFFFFFPLFFLTLARRRRQLEPQVIAAVPGFNQESLDEFCSATREALWNRITGHIDRQKACWAASMQEELDQHIKFVENALDERVVPPASLLALESFDDFLKQASVLVRVYECAEAGHTDPMRLCNLATVDAGPHRPIRQNEPYGPVTVRLASALVGVKVMRVTFGTVDASGQPLALGLDYSEPVVCRKNIRVGNMTVSKSSKMTLAWYSIKVTANAPASREKIAMEMPVCGPFVVITNEKQWKGAMGSILEYELFKNQNQISRFGLCNELQRVYLCGIREPNMADPKRALTQMDFEFIFNLCGLDDAVNGEGFSRLWDWFGSVLSRLRHDRTTCSMWGAGSIVGFISRTDAEALLIQEPPGSFLLRFSTQAPGLFAIAFTDPKGSAVNHYLLTKSDVNPSCSLAKFLLDRPFFTILVKRTALSWQREAKDVALAEWKQQGADPANSVRGYDATLNIPFQALSLTDSP